MPGRRYILLPNGADGGARGVTELSEARCRASTQAKFTRKLQMKNDKNDKNIENDKNAR
jgi:hypothetical protein